MERKRIAILETGVFLCLIFAVFSLSGGAEAGTCEAEPTDMSVSYGELITCEIDTGSDTDLYRFSGNADDRVLIEADWISGDDFVPRITLIAPDGSRLSSQYLAAVIDYVLPQTGTYTVIVNDDYYDYPGKYNLLISCTGGSCLPSSPPPEDTGCNITCNSEPTDMFLQHGTRVRCDISSASDTDLYRFSANANDRVLIEADWISGDDFVPRITLIAPDGSRLSSQYLAAVIDYVLPQTGTYTVIVNDDYYDYPGKYNLIIACTGGSCLPTGNTACSAPTLSSDMMSLHIPRLNYQGNSGLTSFWVDFVYQPDASGNIMFKVLDFGAVQE